MPCSPTLIGGRLRHFRQAWTELGAPQYVLDWLTNGYTIEFVQEPQMERTITTVRQEHRERFREALHQWIATGVIEKIDKLDETGNMCNVFPKEKPSSSELRLLLNAKKMNESIRKRHFKVEGLREMLDLVQPGNWLAKLDVSSAFHLLPINENQKKYLQFQFENEYYQYRCLSQGLSCSPRAWTKICKPVVRALRAQGLRLVMYYDDAAIVAATREQLVDHVRIATELFEKLGLPLSRKSVLEPTQQLEFLGFVVNTTTMKVYLPHNKRRDLIRSVQRAQQAQQLSARQLATLIGSLAQTNAAVPLALGQTRSMQTLMHQARQHSDSWDTCVELNDTVRRELAWWETELKNYSDGYPIARQPDLIITTDASKFGWGAHSSSGRTAQGTWAPGTQARSNNYRELLGAYLGLRALHTELYQNNVCTRCMDAQTTNGANHDWRHVLLRTDNVATMANIRKQGGASHSLTRLARQMLLFATRHRIRLTAEHIAGSRNNLADSLSRQQRDRSDFKLNPKIFRAINEIFSTEPQVDWFATARTAQVPKYCSWQPDPASSWVDALQQDFSNHGTGYAFPPFSLLPRVMRQVEEQRAEMVMIVPLMPGTRWFQRMSNMITAPPIILPYNDIVRPVHRLHERSYRPILAFELVAVHLNGPDHEPKNYLQMRGPRTQRTDATPLDGQTLATLRARTGLSRWLQLRSF